MAKLPDKKAPVTAPPAGQRLAGPLRPLGTPFSMEVAVRKERRHFWFICFWLGAGVLSLGFLYLIGWMSNLGFSPGISRWLSLLGYAVSVIAVTVLGVSPFGFVWSLYQWLRAIWQRRKLIDFAHHPGFGHALETPEETPPAA